MEILSLFTIFVLINTCALSYGCRKDWYNKCKINKDCCSGSCVKEGNWQYGVCQPALDSNTISCYNNWYNKCTDHNECCSKHCEKEPNWKFGVCKPGSKSDKEPDKKPDSKPGGRGANIANSFEECGMALSVPQTLIFGGKKSQPGEFPWHAGIYELKTGKFDQICGGSLISRKIVVSAAHCFAADNLEDRKVYFKELKLYKVALGKHNRDYYASESPPAQIQNIRKVLIPDKYDAHRSHYESDIAVVVLQEEVVYSKVIRPVCIDVGINSFEGAQLVPGAKGKVVGWGRTGTRKFSEILLMTELPYVPREECKQKISSNWLSYLSDEKICAGGTGRIVTTICEGDSGGGLVFKDLRRKKYFLRGIVSLGGSCDGEEGFALFTKLSSYKWFLKDYS